MDEVGQCFCGRVEAVEGAQVFEGLFLGHHVQGHGWGGAGCGRVADVAVLLGLFQLGAQAVGFAASGLSEAEGLFPGCLSGHDGGAEVASGVRVVELDAVIVVREVAQVHFFADAAVHPVGDVVAFAPADTVVVDGQGFAVAFEGVGVEGFGGDGVDECEVGVPGLAGGPAFQALGGVLVVPVVDPCEDLVDERFEVKQWLVGGDGFAAVEGGGVGVAGHAGEQGLLDGSVDCFYVAFAFGGEGRQGDDFGSQDAECFGDRGAQEFFAAVNAHVPGDAAERAVVFVDEDGVADGDEDAFAAGALRADGEAADG